MTSWVTPVASVLRVFVTLRPWGSHGLVSRNMPPGMGLRGPMAVKEKK